MANYHWTWKELLWGMPWAHIQRIMADAPGYEPAKNPGEKGKKTMPLYSETEADLNAYFQAKR